MSLIRQLSLFGVEARAPAPGDLAGLLAAGGQVVRMGGTARVSIAVDHPWRAAVLVAECERRGLAATAVSIVERAAANQVRDLVAVRVEDDEAAHVAEVEALASRPKGASRSKVAGVENAGAGAGAGGADVEGDEGDGAEGEGVEEEPEPTIEVRTAYSTLLVPLAEAWLAGGGQAAPRRLQLDGRALRLWVEAGGQLAGPTSYLLRTDAGSEVLGRALAGAGLRGELKKVGRRAAYLINGRRRLTRLAEMIGDAPGSAPADLWPG